MVTKMMSSLTRFGRLLQKAGPYVVLEVVLPGGTLFALFLYLYRSGQLPSVDKARALGRCVFRTAAGTFDQMAYVWLPAGAVFAGPGSRNDRDGLEPLDLVSMRR